MVVVFPFCAKDAGLLLQLLRWIQRLGGNRKHDAILLADGAVDYGIASECLAQAKLSFAAKIKTVPHVEGWIPGSNALFRYAAMMMQGLPFLWIEPDAAPTKPGWIDLIEAEYDRCGKPFMGAVVKHDTPGYPNPYLEGCAVYPMDAWLLIQPGWDELKSWTLATAAITVPLAHNSALFQHFWGQPNVPPTFRADLRGLLPETVLFHRCKDGSLIHALERKLFPQTNNFIVVLPVFKGDYRLAEENLTWLNRLGQPKTHDLLIWHESSVPDVSRFKQLAQASFASVQSVKYPNAPGPNQTWILAARHLQSLNRAWLWWEPDAVPLKADWLSQLQARYDACGKSFMGPIVSAMGHVNGTAVYPANTPTVCPRTMQTQERFGFDTLMKDEMIHDCHNCGDLIQHAWVGGAGPLKANGSGEVPTFPTKESLRRLSRSAVLFHRCKDASLIRQLEAA